MAMAITRFIKCEKRQSNSDYCRKLYAYISAPEINPTPEDGKQQDPREKCAALVVLGSSIQDDKIITDKDEIVRRAKAAADEAADILDASPFSDKKLVYHFVISFRNTGRQPTIEEALLGARHFLQDMGYRCDNNAIAGVHVDTDNLHVHIGASRASFVSPWKLLDVGNGWIVKEQNRFLARETMRQPGVFELEPKNEELFLPTGEWETVTEKNPVTGAVETFEKPMVKKGTRKKDARPTSFGDRAGALEIFQGKKSDSRILQELLADIDDEMQKKRDERSTQKLKWSDFYKVLARRGVYSEISRHGTTRGLIISLDGKHWRKATKVMGAGWTIDALSAKIDGSFRMPRANIAEIAAKTWESIGGKPEYAMDDKVYLKPLNEIMPKPEPEPEKPKKKAEIAENPSAEAERRRKKKKDEEEMERERARTRSRIRSESIRRRQRQQPSRVPAQP